MVGNPLQCIPAVFMGGGEFELRRQPVVQRHHRAARQVGQSAAQAVVGGYVANGKAAAVQVQQHRQGVVGGRIVACRQ